jgi:glycosyltransferase involved in cell wall biosynthesis
MEAMALGRPVISTYVAGIPELVIPGRHGWLVPAGDALSLSNAINECFQTPIATLSRMGEDGRQRVLMRHNAKVEAARLAALFSGGPQKDGVESCSQSIAPPTDRL